MPSDEGSTPQKLLHRSEGLTEVFGLPDVGCLVSHLSEHLGKGRPAKGERSKAEVNMIERIARVGDEDGREYLLHVRDFTHRTDDHCPWAKDTRPVGVLLRHRERVLAGGDVDAK